MRHYTDASDNPTWTSQGTSTQRYSALLGSQLQLTVNQDAEATVLLSDQHGDVVTTANLGTAATPAASIDGWTSDDEYGAVLTPTVNTGTVNYGWTGAHGRATSDSGLILMGARAYNPVTGLFTSLDPLLGGNANSYVYPTDPVNEYDLSGCGRCRGWRLKVAYVIWETWRGRWYRLWPVSVFAWRFTGTVLEDVKFQSRLLYIVEKKCRWGWMYFRWVFRYQSRRRYTFASPVLPWFTWDYTTSWGWEYGPGARKWVSQWYRW